MLIDCRSQVLPVKVVGDVYALDTFPRLLSGFATYFMTGEKALEARLWPTPETKTHFGRRCEITNFSEAAVSAVAMTFDLAFRDVAVEPGSPMRRSGAVVLRREHPIQI